MNETCLTDLPDFRLLMSKLTEFYMAQQALSRELLVAKHLGICKTITSGENPIKLSNLTKPVQTRLKPNIKSSIPSRNGSREM